MCNTEKLRACSGSVPHASHKAHDTTRLIRVVLVDDHDMLTEAFSLAIEREPDMELVATASTLAEGTRVVHRHRPDVVVTDLRLPDGIATTDLGWLRASGGDPKVMIITGLPTEKAVLDAFAAGATGFLSKAQPLMKLLDAIRRLAEGATVVDPDLVHVLAGRVGHSRATLTTREVEVLEQLATGGSTSTIASALYVSPNTVRNHVSSLFAKLDVHSRLEAVTEATRQGIIAPATPY